MNARHDVICRTRNHRQFASLRAELRADITRLIHHVRGGNADASGIKRRLATALTPQIVSLAIHRVAHLLYVSGWRLLATLLARLNYLLHKLDVHPASCIGGGCLLPHPPGVSFVGSAGRDVTLYSLCACCADPVDPIGSPILGDRVTLGGHAIVIGPVYLGDDVKVAPNVRVDRDVPAGSIVISRNIRVANSARLNHETQSPAESRRTNVENASAR